MQFTKSTITGAHAQRVTVESARIQAQGAINACSVIAPRLVYSFLSLGRLPPLAAINMCVEEGCTAFKAANPSNQLQVLDAELVRRCGLELDGSITTAMAPWEGGMPVVCRDWYPEGLPDLCSALMNMRALQRPSGQARAPLPTCLELEGGWGGAGMPPCKFGAVPSGAPIWQIGPAGAHGQARRPPREASPFF